jgi:hypothetical protein
MQRKTKKVAKQKTTTTNIWGEGDEQAQMLSCDQKFGLNIRGSYYWVDEP